MLGEFQGDTHLYKINKCLANKRVIRYLRLGASLNTSITHIFIVKKTILPGPFGLPFGAMQRVHCEYMC